MNDIETPVVRKIGRCRGNSHTSTTIPFSGFFDGNNHTIFLHLDYIDSAYSDDTHVALFTATRNATISNLRVDGFVRGNNVVGGIVARCD